MLGPSFAWFFGQGFRRVQLLKHGHSVAAQHDKKNRRNYSKGNHETSKLV
jgi:hypothetical protein